MDTGDDDRAGVGGLAAVLAGVLVLGAGLVLAASPLPAQARSADDGCHAPAGPSADGALFGLVCD